MSPVDLSVGKATAFRRWLDDLARRDPDLYAALSTRLADRRADVSEHITLEGVGGDEAAARTEELVLETIVREGRPALLVKAGRISAEDPGTDEAARPLLDRLRARADVIEPMIPLVGRIDVANYPGSATYLGTGWMVDRDVVMTNRHVAELVVRWDGREYVFRPGRFGDPIEVSIDYLREAGRLDTASVRVERVIWIESNPRNADVALLELRRSDDADRPYRIPLANSDASPDADVVVVGYPARAPSDVIRDQAWMERIYGGVYDVKRVAPGMMGRLSRGWATHDCTTLGGNSGSVVLDMNSGAAVALHFAGLYMIENYAVPASTIRRYLNDRPWQGGNGRSSTPPESATPRIDTGVANSVGLAVAPGGSVSVVVPLTITVSVGAPATTGDGSFGRGATGNGGPRPDASGISEAARALHRELGGGGVLATRPGYVIEGRQLTDRECIVVAAHPDRIDAVRDRAPTSYRGYVVEVRPASLDDQLGLVAPVREAVTDIEYNDDDRTGDDFSFDWVEETMSLILHVGPERSWKVLRSFLADTEDELVSSMYEFHAEHVTDAVADELQRGAKLTLVVAPQSGQQRETFKGWEDKYKKRFDGVFVPTGGGGLVATSYHIKVTVRDEHLVWLSSGNWKDSSQPVIDDADLDDPRKTNGAGNREWHVVLDNKELAGRFRNHILADYERSRDLGGELEAPREEVFVDVPVAFLEAVRLERAPDRVWPERLIERTVRVKPLLTPDQKGAVYSKAVLSLIGSAERQLVLQNQYIKITDSTTGYLKELVEALIEKSQQIEDVRIILRGGSGFWDDVSELKRRGLDVARCVKRLANTHTKGIVVDGRRVLIGSHNWSTLGVTLNRDASLIFDDRDVAEYFLEAFEIDWSRIPALQMEEAVVDEGVRVVTDPTQPVRPGFVRMPLSSYVEG